MNSGHFPRTSSDSPAAKSWLRLAYKVDFEGLLHRGLVVLSDQSIRLRIMREHVGCPGVTDIVQLHDNLESGRPLHPDGSRNLDGLRIEVAGVKHSAEVSAPDLQHISAVGAHPLSNDFSHRLRDGRRLRHC